MKSNRRRKQQGNYIEPLGELLCDWIAAAEAWRELSSDASEARCRVARAAYYTATLGYVPPLGVALKVTAARELPE